MVNDYLGPPFPIKLSISHFTNFKKEAGLKKVLMVWNLCVSAREVSFNLILMTFQKNWHSTFHLIERFNLIPLGLPLSQWGNLGILKIRNRTIHQVSFFERSFQKKFIKAYHTALRQKAWYLQGVGFFQGVWKVDLDTLLIP